jgi:peptidoglycan/xylan/chitin deacetylase (PgdA/CDA1 family)
MAFIALKLDVDTLRGTQEGVPRLVELCRRLGVNATFLFSLGPDHTGRAIRRVFRRGFFAKLKRTSVASNYGLKTLLYGTLLPGPDIGRRCREQMRAVAAAGIETGVHCHDHVRWQDGVADAGLEWTRRELERAVAAYRRIFDATPTIHGAAGWQTNEYVPALQAEFGFTLASDVRGRGPFHVLQQGREVGPLQLPTTLPTLDELIGRQDIGTTDVIAHLLALTAPAASHAATQGAPAAAAAGHVYTFHAELEGGHYFADFERLLRGWREQGHTLGSMGEYRRSLGAQTIARCTIERGAVAGRSGELAIQGA